MSEFIMSQKQLARDYGDKEAKVIQNTVGNIFSGQDTSTSINTQMDSFIPASKIANLSQGTFVDSAKMSEEMKAYKKIPVINEFRDADGNNIMQQQIDRFFISACKGRPMPVRIEQGRQETF